MISCGIDQSSYPTGCVVEAYNLIYYQEEEYLDEYFNWVPYDLSTHTSSDCSELFTTQKFSTITGLLKDISQDLQLHFILQPQFNLYNIPMIFYVK